MTKTFRLCVLIIAMIVAIPATAGKSDDKYATETYAAARIAYNMALFQFDGASQTTGIEPVICWPFEIEFYPFYRAVQDRVNATVEALPKRDQGKAGTLVGWYVWNAIQFNWGC